MSTARGKWRLAGGVAAVLVTADVVTKWAVQKTFYLGQSIDVVGDAVRLTYILNPGAAFGLHVGPWSRQIFTLFALLAIGVIVVILRETPSRARSRVAALALVAGGAAGNLLDRLRGSGEVVDFLDVGLGVFRWPVFNLADVGVTAGAVVLVALLWNEEPAGVHDAGVRQGLESAEAPPT